MTTILVERPERGLPGIPRSSRPAPARFLEATVVLVDGRSAVEHDERNDDAGRKAMDAWCWARNASAKVDYIAVEPTSRRAGYAGR